MPRLCGRVCLCIRIVCDVLQSVALVDDYAQSTRWALFAAVNGSSTAGGSEYSK